MSDTQKHNKPNVPNLRFPEFSGEWKIFSLGDLCSEFQSGKGIKANSIKENAPYPVYGGNGLRGYSDFYNHDGDYSLIGRQGAKCGNVRLVSGRSYITEHAIAIKANSKNNTEFLTWLLVQMNLGQYSDQSAQPGLAVNKLVKLKAFVPDLNEQTKIARLLTLLNNRIVVQNKVIEDLITLEKVLINSSFRDIKGENIPLSVIAQRIVDRNANCGCSNVLTISAKDGLVSQLNYFKKSVASQNISNYYLLQKGDFAYNKSYSTDYPWGAVKHLENYNQGILSPLYFCFRANSRVVNIDYLQIFFDTDIWYKHISEIAVEGARNHGLLNMSVSDFMAMPILLPSLVEQNKIVNNLMYFRKKKQSEIQYLMALEKQKKYLLSQMFI